MTDKKPILCLDFDGVLHAYTSGWKGAAQIPDGPVPGAVDFLMEAVRHFSVHIYSSRSSAPLGIDAMRGALRDWIVGAGHPLPIARAMCFDGEGINGLASVLHFPKEKPPAHVSIDDRALTFTGEWPAIFDLLNFKPWNKRNTNEAKA